MSSKRICILTKDSSGQKNLLDRTMMVGWQVGECTLRMTGSLNVCPFKHVCGHVAPCVWPPEPCCTVCGPHAVLALPEGCRKCKISYPSPDLLDQNPHFGKHHQATVHTPKFQKH